MKVHELKTILPYWQDVRDGKKSFDVRIDDRNFKIDDVLRLREWDPKLKIYTGRETVRVVRYILHGDQFGVQIGYCVLGF